MSKDKKAPQTAKTEVYEHQDWPVTFGSVTKQARTAKLSIEIKRSECSHSLDDLFDLFDHSQLRCRLELRGTDADEQQKLMDVHPVVEIVGACTGIGKPSADGIPIAVTIPHDGYDLATLWLLGHGEGLMSFTKTGNAEPAATEEPTANLAFAEADGDDEVPAYTDADVPASKGRKAK